MTEYNTDKEYVKYNEQILSGEIPASKNIILAARRFKERFLRDDIYFDYEDVDRRIKFVAKMKQFKERFAGLPLILLPWQEWIFANIFGFKWVEDNSRVTTKVLLFVARKAGKTALAAALVLVQMFLDNNNGQEVDLIANSTKQAQICFEYITKFGKSLDPNGLILKPFRDTIKMPVTDSMINVKSSDYTSLDGLNPSTFICDEYHAATNSRTYDVLKSGQAFQTSPLAIIITTAGYLMDGYPLFEMRKACIKILENQFDDDAQFSALYELDDNDDWEDSSLWIKANPAIGHTVNLRGLMDDFKTAKNLPSQEPEFKSKHLNIFCRDENGWLDPEFIRENMQPIDIQQFTKKEYVFGGIDLSTTSDLSCFTIMWKQNGSRDYFPDKFIFKTWCYITEKAVHDSPNRDLYKQWIKDGYLKMIEGNVIDYDTVMYDIMKIKEVAKIDTLGYDPYNASQFVINCEKRGLRMQPFSQKLGTFNAPTKEFERLVYTGKVVIDYNPLVIWAFNNVILVHQKGTDNIKPDKSHDDMKIDPVITILESLGTKMFIEGDMKSGDIEIVTNSKSSS